MRTVEELVTLVRDELGLQVTEESTDVAFDNLPGWDSFHLLTLMTVLEQQTGRSLPFSELLEATSLRRVYEAVCPDGTDG